MGDRSHGIDPQRLASYASEIKNVVEQGVEVAIVVGGGNLFRGESLSNAGMNRVVGDQMGMLATAMNGLAICDSLQRAKVKTKMM